VETVIIGGGISGLAAAYELTRQGRTAVMLDPAPVGGVMRTRMVDGCLVEAGPDSFLAAKPAAMELIRELGLESEVIGSNDHQRKTFIRKNGRMVALPDGLMMVAPTKVWPMVTTRLLGWGTKLRMGAEFFRKPLGDAVAERSVAAMVREHYGEEAVDYLAEPLLAGVYGGDPEELSATSVLPRFVEMERRYGSLTRGTLAGLKEAGSRQGPLFRTLRGGMQSWVEALERAVDGRVEMRRESVVALEKTSSGFSVRTSAGVIEAARVIVATPAWAAAKLLAPVDGELADGLAAIGYSSSATVGLVYDEAKLNVALSGFGFLVPKREREFLLACTWVHRKFAHRAPAGKAIVRAFTKETGLGEEEMIGRARKDLERLVGLAAIPTATTVSRWPASMAQYTVGHGARVAAIEERCRRHAGLHLIGNAYRGIGIPDCIQLARDTVRGFTAR
jgi:protoporphyrinogen/coproporphyrinogen III oxidase